MITNFAWDVPNVDPSVSILVVESESSLKRHHALRRLHNHGSRDASASMPVIHYILPGIDARRFSSDTVPAFVPPGCTWRQVSRLVQEKLPAVFVEMAALVYAARPQSRFVMVYIRTLRLLDRISTNRTLHFRLEMDRNESFWSTWSS